MLQKPSRIKAITQFGALALRRCYHKKIDPCHKWAGRHGAPTNLWCFPLAICVKSVAVLRKNSRSEIHVTKSEIKNLKHLK